VKDLKFEMEERICKHPKCKMKFKVMKGSKQEYHHDNCRHRVMTYMPQVIYGKGRAGHYG